MNFSWLKMSGISVTSTQTKNRKIALAGRRAASHHVILYVTESHLLISHDISAAIVAVMLVRQSFALTQQPRKFALNLCHDHGAPYLGYETQSYSKISSSCGIFAHLCTQIHLGVTEILTITFPRAQRTRHCDFGRS